MKKGTIRRPKMPVDSDFLAGSKIDVLVLTDRDAIAADDAGVNPSRLIARSKEPLPDALVFLAHPYSRTCRVRLCPPPNRRTMGEGLKIRVGLVDANGISDLARHR